jgi:peptide methionine sulfoxide reductase msrA/msrB
MRAVRWVVLAGAVLALAAGGCRSAAAPASRDTSETQSAVEPTSENSSQAMPPLNDRERRVIRDKATEQPFSGKYWDFFGNGFYVCRQCGAPLYRSESKFDAQCGWPSFDDAIPGAVRRQLDADGQRIEILCAVCGAHLGHVFLGEGFTPKETRHCANSVSLVFRPAGQPVPQEAIFAGGCFWGVEHQFESLDGVISATSGYCGGTLANPTYEQVCTGTTGYAESSLVVFDPTRISYEKLARWFFEIHDPTQANRQGPDVGSQYRSAVFYRDEAQKQITEKLIAQLKRKGYDAVTQAVPATAFYPAETTSTAWTSTPVSTTATRAWSASTRRIGRSGAIPCRLSSRCLSDRPFGRHIRAFVACDSGRLW